MIKKLYCILFILFIFSSCEKEIDIEIPQGKEDIVVYGFIEQDSIPFVALTKSVPAFSTVDLAVLQNGFVRKADVKLSNGDTTISLIEYELEYDEFKYYFYSVPPQFFFSFRGEIGKTYNLTINAEGKTITASTTIPQPIPLDSIWWKAHPDPENDSLVSLWTKLTDPPEQGNYYRFMNQRNNEGFFPGYFESVFDDGLINGKSLTFSLPRGQDNDDVLDHTNFTYFWKGDTITVRWMTIDKNHFDFWNTFETDRNSSGNPFGSPTKIKSNIKGGLGIWGGYGASYHTIIVPK